MLIQPESTHAQNIWRARPLVVYQDKCEDSPKIVFWFSLQGRNRTKHEDVAAQKDGLKKSLPSAGFMAAS